MLELWRKLKQRPGLSPVLHLIQVFVISPLITLTLGILALYLFEWLPDPSYLLLAPFPGLIGALGVGLVMFFKDQPRGRDYGLAWLLGAGLGLAYLHLTMAL